MRPICILALKGGLTIMAQQQNIDCRNITFSQSLSVERIQRVQTTFKQNIIQRILCFSLYLLGVNRRLIGQALGIPTETAKSIIKTISSKGLCALEDRRYRTSGFAPPPVPKVEKAQISIDKDYIVVDTKGRLTIPIQNKLQIKAVLLSMLNSGLLSRKDVAPVLGLTQAHTTTLAHRLNREGLHSLIDKRQGQKKDYLITPEIKAELVQQFISDIITRGKTSGEIISTELQERCQIEVPARTVRYHLSQMGLRKIKKTLPQLIAEVKKISK